MGPENTIHISMEFIYSIILPECFLVFILVTFPNNPEMELSCPYYQVKDLSSVNQIDRYIYFCHRLDLSYLSLKPEQDLFCSVTCTVL